MVKATLKGLLKRFNWITVIRDQGRYNDIRHYVVLSSDILPDEDLGSFQYVAWEGHILEAMEKLKTIYWDEYGPRYAPDYTGHSLEELILEEIKNHQFDFEADQNRSSTKVYGKPIAVLDDKTMLAYWANMVHFKKSSATEREIRMMWHEAYKRGVGFMIKMEAIRQGLPYDQDE